MTRALACALVAVAPACAVHATTPAQPIVIAPVAMTAPAAVEPEVAPPAKDALGRDELDHARDPLEKTDRRTREAIMNDAELLQHMSGTAGLPPAARATILKRLGDDNYRLAALLPIREGEELRNQAIIIYDEAAKTDPSSPQLDEIHYYRGLAEEQNGRITEAQKDFSAVLQQSPGSKYAPYAHFGLGEYEFAGKCHCPIAPYARLRVQPDASDGDSSAKTESRTDR